MVLIKKKNCIFCGGAKFVNRFKYYSKPKKEVDFQINPKKYFRELVSCINCGHWYAVHKLNLQNLYSGTYNKMNYKNKIHNSFLKIINLPKKKSDNYFRVNRINIIKKKYFNKKKDINLLDIGSGLGVFPYSIKKIGWNCVSVDPDINSVQHLISDLKIKTLHGNYYKIKYAKKFDFVTLNKVLEHVNNPIKFLQKTNKNLDNSGIIYLEVPDAEKASKYGKNREEFFIDHLHVFSKVSLKLMCKKAGFEILHISRIKEPSGKYTLYGFLKK